MLGLFYLDLSAASNPEHEAVRLLGLQDLLIRSPAGCGKTEALARRAAHLLTSRTVCAPQKILALTYSNRATRNLAKRIETHVGTNWREYVTVTNFHGIAARLLRAHGGNVGVDPEFSYPDRVWRRNTVARITSDFAAARRLDAALSTAKSSAIDDEAVVAELRALGVPDAIEFERLRLEDERLDYDDLIRHAVRLLSVGSVRHLYKCHFPTVLVDEVQDLTMLHLELVLAIGGGAVTAAGDEEQGIYSFAGAATTTVMHGLRTRGPAEIAFRRSYRSSPAVLRAVNALSALNGVEPLECASPEDWPSSGFVVSICTANPEAEAVRLVDACERILSRSASTSIGVIVRRRTRFETLRRALDGSTLPFEVWELPTYDPVIVRSLKRNLNAARRDAADDREALARLQTLCQRDLDPSDLESIDRLAEAVATLAGGIDDGDSLEGLLARCRDHRSATDAVTPGVHLLTAHSGKGQQFDWVVVLGLEEGHIPDFRNVSGPGLDEERRVLHVILSRARLGLILTVCEQAETRYGLRGQDPSRWFATLEPTVTHRM